MYPLAYHITWTAYGSWLPGDARGWVRYGDAAIQKPDPALERSARERMAEEAVVLADDQRVIIETTIRTHCAIRGWILHAVNARTNHIHVVVSAARDPETVRDQFKAWCSRKLSDAEGLTEPVAKGAGRRHWFTEGGDIGYVDTEEHLHNVIRYVWDQ